MNTIYGLFACLWTLMALACAIILPADMAIVPTLICAGIAMYSTARSNQ